MASAFVLPLPPAVRYQTTTYDYNSGEFVFSDAAPGGKHFAALFIGNRDGVAQSYLVTGASASGNPATVDRSMSGSWGRVGLVHGYSPAPGDMRIATSRDGVSKSPHLLVVTSTDPLTYISGTDGYKWRQSVFNVSIPADAGIGLVGVDESHGEFVGATEVEGFDRPGLAWADTVPPSWSVSVPTNNGGGYIYIAGTYRKESA